MKYNIYLLFFLVLVSCSENQARRPKSHSTTNFYNEVLAHNKKLNKIEERHIKSVLSKDTIHKYLTSNNGLWYRYVKKDTLGLEVPALNNVVTLKYDVKDLFDNSIYEERLIDYKVGKEKMIAGIADGVQLMKKGEEVIFIIPSYRAYGVSGDGHKIKMNKTLKSRIKLIDIKQNNNENN